jgi:hypothetical protein
MNSAQYRVRRATLDDLHALRPLWESMRFPVADLERRLTEFQVGETADGRVLGAVGFQISGRHARIHSEAYADFAEADPMRPLLWDRLHALAKNQGVARLWTQEGAPFWTRCGLRRADAEAFKKLPPEWRQETGAWLTLQLKDEDVIVSLEKELAMFMQAEKQRTARAFQQARALKFIATLAAIILAIFVAVAVIYMLRKNPGLFHWR